MSPIGFSRAALNRSERAPNVLPVDSQFPPRRTAVPLRRGTALRLPPKSGAPDQSDLGAVREWLTNRSGPTAVDLFSGAGGLSLGLADAGFSVLLGADSDPWAVETHTANVGGLGYCGDLSDPTELLEQLDGWGIGRVDVVAGGVPCQPFSRAGQAKIRELIRAGERHASDPRASLWRSFMRLVKRLEPSVVLVENVPDLPAKDDGVVLSGFLESLEGLGYRVDARIIDCFRHGVPQHRSRLFLVGLKDGRTLEWPTPTDDLVNLRDAIGDLPPVPGGQRAEKLPYLPRPGAQSDFQRRMRRELSREEQNWVFDHMTRAVRADDWEAYTGLQPGQTYADVPSHLQRYRTDIFTDKYRRLSWEELSRTITAHIAKDGYWYIHPEQHRTLSIREAARLQTFPDRFRFAGQPSHRYTQIGNAVPPLVGEAVGRSIMTALRTPLGHHAPTDARDRLLRWYATETPHPWRRRSESPWHVLAAELALDRAGADVAARSDALRRVAPSPRALREDPNAVDKLGEITISPHAIAALQDAAETIFELFEGQVPSEDIDLRAIPGVGDSTAKAVLCFGFGRAVVPLNSSAARVASRVAGQEHRRRWQLRLDLHQIAGPAGPNADFNAAILHLGSMLCHPVDPECDQCPLNTMCGTGSARRSNAEVKELLTHELV